MVEPPGHQRELRRYICGLSRSAATWSYELMLPFFLRTHAMERLRPVMRRSRLERCFAPRQKISLMPICIVRLPVRLVIIPNVETLFTVVPGLLQVGELVKS
jgi:hypothetical protein